MNDVWNQWARTWGIPDVAIADLVARITITGVAETAGRSESAVSADIRLAAARRGDMVLWRNNSGAFTDDTGRLVRFGLGHESAESIKRMKSPDLVGIWRRLITQEMVGLHIGQFIGPEVKKPGWRHSNNNDRDRAQAAFGATVTAMGGISLRITSDQPIKDLGK